MLVLPWLWICCLTDIITTLLWSVNTSLFLRTSSECTLIKSGSHCFLRGFGCIFLGCRLGTVLEVLGLLFFLFLLCKPETGRKHEPDSLKRPNQQVGFQNTKIIFEAQLPCLCSQKAVSARTLRFPAHCWPSANQHQWQHYNYASKTKAARSCILSIPSLVVLEACVYAQQN